MDQTLSLSHLLKEQEVAEILNMEVSTLRRWRWAGDGPRFIKIGASVRYDPQTLKDYLAERVRASTSDVGPQSATA